MFLTKYLFLPLSLVLYVSAIPSPASDADATPNAVADSSVEGVDQECVLACSHWAVTMGYCRGQYNDFSQQRNLTYTNNFLSCLCAGTNSTGTLGSELMADSASFCMGCEATPKKIKDNLGTFLGLCQVQSSNGTATNATEFMPVGYSTSNDRSKDAVTGSQGRQYTLDTQVLMGTTAVLGLVSWTIL